MKRILFGGSPCTFWSVAKQIGRETTSSGMGWELFKNYLVAKEKFRPDFFLYENVASASDGIKKEISKALGFPLVEINAALVSAQQRKRIYCTNVGIPQPEDRHIYLRDVLEPKTAKGERYYDLAHVSEVASRELKTCKNEPVRIGDVDTNAQAHRVYSTEGKSTNLIANAGGQGGKTGLYLTPVKLLSQKELEYMVRIIPDGRNHFDFGYIHNSTKDKSQCLLANLHKGVPFNVCCDRVQYLNESDFDEIEFYDNGNIRADDTTIYKVKDAVIKIANLPEPHRTNLMDGYYVIRKLTPEECERLQTMPVGYTGIKGNSATQRYKQLGNGWCAEVIIHIIRQWGIPKDERLEVLSMYDGISTAQYCLDKLGYRNITYKAMEIDKYAVNVATHNYPETVELGDAFQVREDGWTY